NAPPPRPPLPLPRHPRPSAPTPTDRDGRFRVQIVDTAGTRIQTPFTPLIADDPSQERERFGAFEVMVPVVPSREIASLTLIGQGGKAVATMKRSRPPRINVLTPRPGAKLRG